jgi:hypothetical protein
MTFRNTLAAAASSCALVLTAAPALMMTAQTATAQTEAGYSAAELDAFVTALLEVNDLRAAYSQRLEQASDESAQQAIVEEGNTAIVAAIDQVEGMDVELYVAILEQAGADATLNERISRRLQDASGG